MTPEEILDFVNQHPERISETGVPPFDDKKLFGAMAILTNGETIPVDRVDLHSNTDASLFFKVHRWRDNSYIKSLFWIEDLMEEIFKQ